MRCLLFVPLLALIALRSCARSPMVEAQDGWSHLNYVAIDCIGREHLPACKPDPDDHINDTSRGRGGKGK